MPDSRPDPARFEYRWRTMDAFAHPRRPRAQRHYERAAEPRPTEAPLDLAPGETIDHVLHHIMPGKPDACAQRHGPYVFWLYAQAPEPVTVETTVGQAPAEQATVAPSDSPEWRRLGAFWLEGRVPRLAIRHAAGGALTCRRLLFTDDATFEPAGAVEDVERRIYGFARAELGRTRIEPDHVTAGTETELVYTYEAGPAGVAAGGGLRLRWPAKYGAMIQATDPDAPLFVAVDWPEGVRGEAVAPAERAPSCREGLMTLTVTEGGLRPGDRVRVTVRRYTHYHVIAETYFLNHSIHWWTPLAPLATEVDAAGVGAYAPLPESHTHRLTVLAKPAARLHVAVPSTPGAGPIEPSAAAVLDEHNNPLASGDGVDLEWLEPIPPAPGVHRGRARDRATGLEAAVGPVWLADDAQRPMRLFWGELHGHSSLSDGLGDPADYYRHARDVAGLDFCASAEHICYLSDNDWRWLADLTNRWNEPGRFVTLVGYEWAGDGGHHCLYARGDWRDPGRGMAPPSDRIATLWPRFADQIGAVLATTHGAIKTAALKRDWDEHDWRIFRSLELYTVGGSHEHFGHALAPEGEAGISFQDMLARGSRVGVLGGSDNHESRPGLTPDNWPGKPTGGLTGLWAPELTREAVFDAVYRRHTYATTGARTIVHFTVNGAPMGGACSLADGPNRLGVRVHATAPLDCVEVVADGQVVGRWLDQPAGIDLHTTDDRRPGYYYLRLLQQDGHYAWTSPVFHSEEDEKRGV